MERISDSYMNADVKTVVHNNRIHPVTYVGVNFRGCENYKEGVG